ncbi:hypothetical protein JL721_3960 [Aureococcus anophagefferens]|nr:hypothetical protein JL721_3960 [Aureococcus anophagefferens]
MALELTFGSDEWCDDVINSSGRVALVANATSKVVFCDGAAVHAEAGGTGGADGLAEKAAATFEPDDLEGEISAVAVVVKKLDGTGDALAIDAAGASAAWDPLAPNRLATLDATLRLSLFDVSMGTGVDEANRVAERRSSRRRSSPAAGTRGTLCAAVSAERNVSVWDVATGAPILIYGCDLAIKAFAFCSSGGAESLVLASADGAFAVAGVVGADEEEEEDDEEDASPRKRLIEDAAGEISDEEDLVDMMPQPSRKKKKKVQVDSDDDLSLSPLEANEPTDDVIVGDRDLDEPAPMDAESFADDGAEPDADPFAVPVAAPPPTVPFQPPFMVSSTVAEEETAARFLHWSHRGSVTARAEEGGLEFAFEVEHYAEGAARGRVVRFVDRRDFTLGTLGARGAFFATGGDDLDESQLYFRPLSSWASDGGWSAKLPPGEFATTLAAGDDWVAATTSRPPADLLRRRRGDGRRAGWPLVACCAHKRSLAVAYHRSSPTADGQQDVWIQVLDVEGRAAVNGDGSRLPLPPGSKLATRTATPDAAAGGGGTRSSSDRAVLRQLVAAAKQQLYLRAFDLARRLELPESLDLALRIANSHGEEALTSRVEDLVAFRNELDTHAVADHPAARPPSPAYDAPAEAYEPEPDAPPVADENDEAPLEAPLARRSSNAPSPVEGAPPAKAPPAPFTNPSRSGRRRRHRQPPLLEAQHASPPLLPPSP